MLQPVNIRDGHDNFFTPLRLILALMVVIGHTYCVVLGHDRFEPQIFFNYTFSYIAVNVFFIASGFLVTKSMLYRGDMAEFSSARILRIFPALAVHVLFVMFLIGPFVTNLPLREFFTDPQFFTQPIQVLSFYQTDMVMPGAFERNSEPFASIALWTLRYEVLAYIGTAAIFMFGLMHKKWMLLAQFVFFACLWPIAIFTGLYDALPATGQAILRFGIPYSLGAAVFAYRDRIKFHILGIPILGIFAALFHNSLNFEIMLNLWLGYMLFWAAYVKIPALNRLQSMSDISYGVYIYHWVILQTLFYFFPLMGIGDLFISGALITIILSMLSWYLVEKPALKFKKGFARKLRRSHARSVFDPETVLLD